MLTVNIQQAENKVTNLLKANYASLERGTGVPLIPFLKAGPGLQNY